MDETDTIEAMLEQLEPQQAIAFTSKCVTTFEPLWRHLATPANQDLFAVVATDKLNPLKDIPRDEVAEFRNQIRSFPEFVNEYPEMPREAHLNLAGRFLFYALDVRVQEGAYESLRWLSDSSMHLAAELDGLLGTSGSRRTKATVHAVRSPPPPEQLQKMEIERQLRVLSAFTGKSNLTADASQDSVQQSLIAKAALQILAYDQGRSAF